MKVVLLILMFVNPGYSFELIAHRGIHQNYNRDGLNDETCTATRVYDAGHEFLENTVQSIEKSFNLGADVVELDIHPIKSGNDRPNLIVFHDWTLNCRTDASCEKGCNCSDSGVC